MKKFRKISALMLALALICALAVSAFAETVTDGPNDCGTVKYTARLDGTISRVTASVSVSKSSERDYYGSIEIHYVYCDETMVRPSNYTYASVTRNFTKYNIATYGSRTVECSSGNVMIEASADYQMIEELPNGTAIVSNTDLYLGLY